VVAEGVETPEQMDMLRALGSEYVQGYLLSRPLPAGGLEAMLLEESVLTPTDSGRSAARAEWAGLLAARRM